MPIRGTTARPDALHQRPPQTAASTPATMASAPKDAPGVGDSLSWALSFVVTVAATVAFALLTPELRHWMLVPTALAGFLLGVDVAEWARGRRDVLAPASLVGLFGFHFVYLAPLLHVSLDYWPKYVLPAADWRDSLGFVGVINMLGLTMYRIGMALPVRDGHARRWSIDRRSFVQWAVAGVLVGVVASIAVVANFGGLSGYLSVVTSGREALTGMGWLLLISEAWPLLLFSAILVARLEWLREHKFVLFSLLVSFVLLQFLAGGLRGSRSNTIWPVLMATGLVHLVVLRIQKRVLLAGGIALIGFMYVYGFYKAAGTEALELVAGRVSTDTLATETGRNFSLLLLEDFGRAGTQAIVVDRVTSEDPPNLGGGAGYLGDVLKLLPGSSLGGLPDKVSLGTDALYGPGSYARGVRSSRIYGLLGEGVLNFGAIGAAFVFIPFTILVRHATRLYRGALGTGRLAVSVFLAPVASITLVLMLGSDLDNVIWFLLKHALPLLAVVWLARRAEPPEGSIIAAVPMRPRRP